MLAALILGLVLASSSWSQVPSSIPATIVSKKNQFFPTEDQKHLVHLNKEIIATLANLQKKNTPYSIDFAQYAQNDLRHHKISDPIATLACKPLLFSQQAEYKFKF